MNDPRVLALILFIGGCSSESSGLQGNPGQGGQADGLGGMVAMGGRGAGGVTPVGAGGSLTPGQGGVGTGGSGTGGDRNNMGGTPAAGGRPGTGGSGPVGTIDAGGVLLSDGGPSPRPPGTVPLLVASGSIGRTAFSCDDGLTWKAQDFQGAPENEMTEKGLAFGHGVFMRSVGWGGQCSFMRSEDGATWKRLLFKDVGLGAMTTCGGITYNGDGFTMVHSSGATFASDRDGLKWKQIGMFNNSMVRSEHVREVVGDGPSPGILLAGGANQPAGILKNPPHVSVDGGKTWKLAMGCSTFHAQSIGEEGGGALGAGRLVFVGYKGQVCTSTNMTTWTEAQVPLLFDAPMQGKVSFDGTQFWVADGSRVLVSPNGMAWTERKLPAAVRLHAVARTPGGAWAGLNRTASTFFRSVDGLTWTPATSPPAGGVMYRLVAGYGTPSVGCPAR